MRPMLQARKTAMKVTRGKVRRKNRTMLTPGAAKGNIRIRRKPPLKGRKHVVTIGDVRKFIALMSEWRTELAGLSEVTLERGDLDFDACYHFRRVAIKIQPWPTLSPSWYAAHVEDHEAILTA